MSDADILAVIRDELARLAPEIAFEALDPTRDLRDQVDLDSMDFLNLLTALHQRLGVEIPDAEAAKLSSLQSLVAYLARRGAAARL